MELDRESRAWAAGLFEGEGSPHLCTNSTKNKSGKVYRYGQARAKLAMTDYQAVNKFALAVGVGRLFTEPFSLYGKRLGREWNDQLTFLASKFEHFQFLACLLWPWLGDRRKRQFVDALARSGRLPPPLESSMPQITDAPNPKPAQPGASFATRETRSG